MSKSIPTVLNLSDLQVKRRLMQKVSMLSGLYEVTLKPRKLTRTLNQNRYYWAAVVSVFAQWLRDEWGDNTITSEQAHELLKKRILGSRVIVDKTTGEELELPATTRTLDTKEFGEYVDACAAWLAEFCGIVVLPPELFYEQREVKAPPLKNALKESIKIVRERKSG